LSKWGSRRKTKENRVTGTQSRTSKALEIKQMEKNPHELYCDSIIPPRRKGWPSVVQVSKQAQDQGTESKDLCSGIFKRIEICLNNGCSSLCISLDQHIFPLYHLQKA